MRFLSWRISQHHLHLHSVHRPAVEQRHGLVCTLEPERHREEGRCQFRVKYMYIFIYCSCSNKRQRHLFVSILDISNLPPRNEMDLQQGTKATGDTQRKKRLHSSTSDAL